MPPRPGDPYANAFRVEPGQCWRIAHDERLQAMHCPEQPAWKGTWRDAKGSLRHAWTRAEAQSEVFVSAN
jgi:hypothetical protein